MNDIKNVSWFGKHDIFEVFVDTAVFLKTWKSGSKTFSHVVAWSWASFKTHPNLSWTF